MMNKIKSVIFIMNSPRFLLHIIIFLLSKNKDVIICDIKKAIEHHLIHLSSFEGLLYLLTFDRYFRNVFYYRIGYKSYFCKWWAKPHPTFTIGTYTPIGKGFLAIHPFSTIIHAKSIGDNLIIKNDVTIGSTSNGLPVIMNNVEINVGAIIIGDIIIGNNVVVGAGAVVTKNIPDYCTVIGNPAFIIRSNGLKVKQLL